MMRTRPSSWLAAAVVTALLMSTLGAAVPDRGVRQVPRVDLGDAYRCVAMAGDVVTNTGLTTLTGDLVVSPGDEVIGFPPGEVRGEIYLDDTVGTEMRQDAVAAYHDARGRSSNNAIPPELGGRTIPPGVYESTDGTFHIDGTLTLDAQGVPDAVFIFQADSVLTTARVSNIDLVNGAQAENVVWVVGDDASLGRYSTFRGNLLAWNTIRVSYGAAIYGRTMALNEALHIEGTDILPTTRVTLPVNPPTETSLTSSPNPSRNGEPVTFTATVSGDVQGFRPTGPVLFMEGTTVIGSVYADVTGIARFTTSELTRGVHEIHAVYVNGGTAVYEAWVKFAPSESPTITQQVLNRR
ncbi:ice-binding family protein [Nonomuraea sp. NPDC049784]|uniref:ice-binding family protein n=1 Tax=Nonomuraea sp. NPDC049784 TaxID=3154361 RepID=UPI00340948C7